MHLIHFDIGHAGGVPGDLTRFMVKFEYIRTEEPTAPSWLHTAPEWPLETMEDMCIADQPRMPALWESVWRWMLTGREQGTGEASSAGAGVDRAACMDVLRAMDPDRPYAEPLTAAYDLVASCSGAEDALRELAEEMLQLLLSHEQRSKPIDALARLSMAKPDDKEVRHEARGAHAQLKRKWNDGGANVMELASYALVAIGSPSVPFLLSELGNEDEWVRVNVAWALGELGFAQATEASAAPLADYIVNDPSQAVVRTAVDAAGTYGSGAPEHVQGIIVEALATLVENVRDGAAREHQDSWLINPYAARRPELVQPALKSLPGKVNQHMVMTMVAQTFIKLAPAAARSERGLAALKYTLAYGAAQCGYASDMATEALLRTGSADALSHAVEFMRNAQFDGTLAPGRGRMF